MKKFQVFLTKTYEISICAENKIKAKRFSEYYTGDITDLSTTKDRKLQNFEIEGIECKINDAFEAHKVIEE